MKRKSSNYLISITILFFASLLAGCGGGSGGSDFQGAGNVSIRVSPSEIDVGDRALVEVSVDNVNSDGVFLKIRLDSELSYVPETALLEVDGDEVSVAPAFNLSDGEFVYIVFIFSADSFGENARGTLSFQLNGEGQTKNGGVAVDLDVDDPLIDNLVEFSLEDTQFQIEDEVQILIEG